MPVEQQFENLLEPQYSYSLSFPAQLGVAILELAKSCDIQDSDNNLASLHKLQAVQYPGTFTGGGEAPTCSPRCCHFWIT